MLLTVKVLQVLLVTLGLQLSIAVLRNDILWKLALEWRTGIGLVDEDEPTDDGASLGQYRFAVGDDG